MNLGDIKRVSIPRKKRTRLGRGTGSNTGKTCGKGMKGQNSRSGVTLPVVFEGGTMPLYRRIPKRGFTNARFKGEQVSVNVEQLNAFKEGDEVTLEALKKAGIIKVGKVRNCHLKLLGQGELKVEKLKIKVHKISKTAKEQVEKANGSVEIIKIQRFKRARRRKSS